MQVLRCPSGLSGHGETRHEHGALRQRLRGGWFAPLMPDVPSHQAPNLEPQDVRSMLRSPSTTSLTENSDKKARPGRWFARVATRLRRRQRYTHTHTHTHTHTVYCLTFKNCCCRQKPVGNIDDALKMSTCDELTANTGNADIALYDFSLSSIFVKFHFLDILTQFCTPTTQLTQGGMQHRHR